jgi:hypothetical protein
MNYRMQKVLKYASRACKRMQVNVVPRYETQVV